MATAAAALDMRGRAPDDLGMFPQDVESLVVAVLQAARAKGVMLGTAESCTGGLVAGALTAIAGSSDVVSGGLVTYSNAAKQALVKVAPALLQAHGAVSEPVARAMAEGALEALDVGMAVAITGIAGPAGGSVSKPVGLVWFACAERGGGTIALEERFGDMGREAVRLAAVRTALALLRDGLASGC